MNTTNTCEGGVFLRAQTSQIVANVAQKSGELPYQVWQRIYIRLGAMFGFDIYAFPRKKGESLLSVVEKYDLIDKVYSLAFAEQLYLQSSKE